METSNSDDYAPMEASTHASDAFSSIGKFEETSEDITTVPGSSRCDGSGVDSGSCKRKAEASSSGRPHTRRRIRFTKQYDWLPNPCIDPKISWPLDGEDDGGGSLKQSQIGLITWTTNEKNDFFQALDRHGRHNPREIASTIGTKSELEVAAYLELLQRGLSELQAFAAQPEALQFYEIPAALEISPVTEILANEAAEALNARAFTRDLATERNRAGELAVLDVSVAKTSEAQMKNPEAYESTAVEENVHEAFSLLNLANMIELSTKLFMNSRKQDANWQYIAGPGQSPAILYTAFLDIYNLVLTITKRIVASAVFFASSRLRATEMSWYSPSKFVRVEDVSAALKVLSLRADADEYWSTMARRCKLRVYEEIDRTAGPRGKLSYDEVELRLGHSRHGHSKAGSREGWSDKNIKLESHGNSSDASSDDSKPSDPESSSERAQDDYAEAVDRRDGLVEEEQLRKRLGAKPLDEERPVVATLPKRPESERGNKKEVADWRDWCNYRSLWEIYDAPIPTAEFECRTRPVGDDMSSLTDSSGDLQPGDDEEDSEDIGSDDGVEDGESVHG